MDEVAARLIRRLVEGPAAHGPARLSVLDVLDICDAHEAEETNRAIARRFEISRSVVSRIVNGHDWRWVLDLPADERSLLRTVLHPTTRNHGSEDAA